MLVNGTAAIVIDGNYYPDYNAPIKGDTLAEDPNAKFVKIGDQYFVLDTEDTNPDDQQELMESGLSYIKIDL